MCAALRIRLLPLVLVAYGVFVPAARANAGWITIRNDTNQVVVVQDTCTVNGVVKRGTPVRLLPGETIREFRSTTTAKTIEVFDNQRPATSLFKGDLDCKNENQTFSIACEGKTTTVKATTARPATGPKK